MEDICGICRELVIKESDRTSVTFECGHLYHLDCYCHWFCTLHNPLIANFNVDDRIFEEEKVDIGLSSHLRQLQDQASSFHERLTHRILANLDLFVAGEHDVKTGETSNGGGSSRGGSGDWEVAAREVAAREEVEGAVMTDTTETATMSSRNGGCDCGCED